MKQISRVVILAFALCLAFSVLASAQEIRINFRIRILRCPKAGLQITMNHLAPRTTVWSTVGNKLKPWAAIGTV